MTAAELRAITAQGPAVVMCSREDMLKLLDENARLQGVLHRISLGSQNSGTTKESLGREAREAIAHAKGIG